MSNIEAGAPPERSTARTVKLVGAALGLLIVGGVLALAGERLLFRPNGAEMRIMAFQDWRVVCPPLSQANARCALTQDVVRDQGGALVSLVLDNTAAGSPLTITVPHGVLLGPGLGFAAGNDPVRAHPYETCTQVGCVAFVPVDAAMLKSLRESMSGQVVVVQNNGQPATIPFSLKGFSEGYAQLASEQSRRGSMLGFLTH